MRRGLALVGVAAGLVAFAGCGDELEDFRNDELRPLEENAQEQRSEISGLLLAVRNGNAADARALRDEVDALEGIHADLAELDPPERFSETYEEFVTANGEFVAQLRQFADALESADVAAQRSASQAAEEALGRSQEAIQPLHG